VLSIATYVFVNPSSLIATEMRTRLPGMEHGEVRFTLASGATSHGEQQPRSPRTNYTMIAWVRSIVLGWICSHLPLCTCLQKDGKSIRQKYRKSLGRAEKTSELLPIAQKESAAALNVVVAGTNTISCYFTPCVHNKIPSAVEEESRGDAERDDSIQISV